MNIEFFFCTFYFEYTTIYRIIYIRRLIFFIVKYWVQTNRLTSQYSLLGRVFW